ncbi:MAG: hypothetical protein ABL907_13980 [Hyphomicrobium sp.]
MTVFNDRAGDTTHVNHPTLATNVQFLGHFNNTVDPVFGFTTDFDYFQIDLTGATVGTKIIVSFVPKDAYFYRVSARLDEDANLHNTSFFPGANQPTWINHQPLPLPSINGSGTFIFTVPNSISAFDHPSIELEIRGGGPPNGTHVYSPLDYAINLTSTPVIYKGTAAHRDFYDTHHLSLREIIRGALNDDFIWTGQADDITYGGDGRDVNIGDRGNDVINGDNGSPVLGSADQLLGGYGNDTMSGNGGNDYMNGEWDNDTMHGQSGNDLMYGGFGGDRLYGGDGNDFLYGATTANPNGAYFGPPILVNWNGVTNRAMAPQFWSIAGEAQFTDASNDLLDGGNGNDQLYGQAGNDILRGGAGADRLTGGTGRDLMAGGLGADVFDYNIPNESKGGTRDYIGDFQHRVDKIDVSTIDANSLTPGNQIFVYLGAKPYTGLAGELRSDGTVVHADLNGDKIDDFSIGIKAGTVLDRLDFIL